jgi:hypothetical protein
MSNSTHIWQQRFKDPAILTAWEIHILNRLKQDDIPVEDFNAWFGFAAAVSYADIHQLVIDGWATYDGEFYRLAPDAPAFNIQKT